MPDTLINQETTNVDLNKIAALQQKRTLAFINHFVISTVQFLNKFAKQCELKLMQFERKLEKINATMVLLEARLSSIPEVNTDAKLIKAEDTSVIANEETKQRHETIIEEEKETSNDTVDITTNKIKPEYERFVKMVQVGVPKDAVKLKISLEGLDPNELDKILS
ncbi:unnamed protein product, partial [Brenthis ino]